ncbi:hypothetical protein FCK90_12365 [Kocuria coralli]|uniref:Uncharacterized protein n=1 Tax=Kocuria coralli TaxID=1461025 RepID=A0A5J5KV73_9MICC|nr:hypothetical protein [Kocuria coralli]KAA9393432.1 hypothetical protein FCK90_12365 [Kocuria coralli]
MDTPDAFTTPLGPPELADLGAWAGRGRRVIEPVSGNRYVLLELGSAATDGKGWAGIVHRLEPVDSPYLAVPRAIIDQPSRSSLLYEELPERSFADDVGRLGGAVQSAVLTMVADVAEGLAVLHDHGATLRRMSLRDLLRAAEEVDETPGRWQILVSPDSGIRAMSPGDEEREAHGDLVMLAAAAATVLTGRRPAPGRDRAPLATVCPALPAEALDALDDLLEDLGGAGMGGAGMDRSAREKRFGGAGREAVVAYGDSARRLAEAIGQSLSDAADAGGETEDDMNDEQDGEPEEAADGEVEDGDTLICSQDRDSTQRVLELLRGGGTASSEPAERRSSRTRMSSFTDRGWDGDDEPAGAGAWPGRYRSSVGRYLLSWRMSWRIWGAGVLVVVVLAGAVMLLMPRDQGAAEAGGVATPPAAGNSSPTSSEAVDAGTGVRAPDAEVLADLIAVRAAAFRDRDPGRLEEVYVPGASDLAEDQATLAGLSADPGTAMHAFSGLEMAIDGEPAVEFDGAGSAVARMTVTATGIEGGQEGSQEVEMSLDYTPDGWRIKDVEPR